ncbi:MAG: hypothetical protein QOE35_2448 [Actinomycetota bacterium]
MPERTDLLLGFTRHAAQHSAVAGTPLSELLRAAREALLAGTGASAVTHLRAEVVGEDLLLRHEVELDRALDEAGVPEGPPADVALPVYGADGELFTIVLPGADLRTVPFAAAVVEVLTSTLQRHWREVQHEERADALREAQRHTQVGCFEWDIVTNKVRWSDELFRIYGCEPQSFEPTFEEFLERIHPDDREAIRASVYEAYDERRDYRIEERIIRPDGTERLLSSWGHMITNERNEPVKIVGSCQDVTDFRRAMDELERRNQALELNDNVVQGLAAASYALRLGLRDEAAAAIEGTLGAARTMIDDLLAGSGDGVQGPGLVREQPAPSVLGGMALPVAPAGDGPLRVVLADDSEDVRLLVALNLAEDGGFTVVGQAADGLEAIALAEAHQPDVILLDLAMPVLDGFDAIPRLRAASAGSAIVVLSGFDAHTAASPALERGATAFIEKAALGPDLGDAIRDALSKEPHPVS